jgi:hypothetical protein
VVSQFKIEGVEDVQKLLKKIAPREASNLARATTHGLASEGVKLARQKMQPFKRTGNLIKATKSKRRRTRRGFFISDVVVTRGKNSKYDGYYWHFWENGTKDGKTPAIKMFARTQQEMLANMNQRLTNQFVKKLVKKLKKK